MSQLCTNKILIKTISWVYMRTDNDGIYKIGRTSQKDPFLRSSDCKKSKIICFCGTYDSVNCEKQLKESFAKEYKLVKGAEYFKGNIYRMLSTFYKKVLDFNKSYIEECENYKTSENRSFVISHHETQKSVKDAKDKIEAMYYRGEEYQYETIEDAILEIKRLKKENKILKEQLAEKIDKVAARNKRYYEKNKEKIKCECGSVITKPNYSTHLKSNKHLKWIKNK